MLKDKVNKYLFNILSILGLIIVVIVLGLMIFINVQQADEHINFAPNFPVYRESDTTELNLLKNELIDNGINTAKIQRSMEGTNTSLILSTIGIIAALLLNPLLFKVLAKVKTLDTKVDSMDITNKEEHATIHKELKAFKVENKTLANLDETLSHYLEITPTDISPFISHEARRLVYFVELVLNSKFDKSILPASKVKLDVIKAESRHEIKNRPAEFKKRFTELQDKDIDKLYTSLSDIVYDDVRNSKDSRFRMVCEQYLENHLSGILQIYNDTKNKE